ncbi:MAG: error-prone DNA polymerase, partial [Phycisphaerae bacterium]
MTDRNSLAGVVRAYAAAKETSLRLLIGAEIVPFDGPAMVLLPTDRTAYGRLSRLITTGRRRAAKGSCRIGMSDVLENSDGLICCVPLSTESRLRREGGYAPEKKCILSDSELRKIFDAFGDRC